jgi:microcompartment protein CcmL/EutN
MPQEALGLIETYGLVPAVEAADAAVKAAPVKLAAYSVVTGGLIAVHLRGEVAAVKAAVDAGAAAAARVGEVVSIHVIARLDPEVEPLIPPPAGEPKSKGDSRPTTKPKPAGDSKPTDNPKATGNPRATGGSGSGDSLALDDITAYEFAHITAYEALPVRDLRRVARTMKGLGLSSKEITFSNKEQLLEAIRRFLAKGGN